MTVLAVAILVIALVGMIATGIMLFVYSRRDKRRATHEMAVAKAAQEYLARYKIRSRIIAATLPDDSVALMVETPPHKKLRFSYIIEQPIRNFIHVHTGVKVSRIFWRFPLPPKLDQAPEVQYADPSTIKIDVENEGLVGASPPSPASSSQESEDNEDDYFQHQSYHIEEVSWEDFSTVSGGDVPEQISEPVKK